MATQSDHRAARDYFALAPSRVMGNLDVRLMWALAWRAPKDQQRGARADRADEPREFLMGAPRIHGELLKLGFDVSQATVSRYMPRRTYLPSQSWRSFLRNQALGIGTISLGDAGRLSDKLLDLVRSWIAGVVRGVTKVRDSFRRGLIEPSLTLHRLRPYRSSNRTAQRDPRSGCCRSLGRPPL